MQPGTEAWASERSQCVDLRQRVLDELEHRRVRRGDLLDVADEVLLRLIVLSPRLAVALREGLQLLAREEHTAARRLQHLVLLLAADELLVLLGQAETLCVVAVDALEVLVLHLEGAERVGVVGVDALPPPPPPLPSPPTAIPSSRPPACARRPMVFWNSSTASKFEIDMIVANSVASTWGGQMRAARTRKGRCLSWPSIWWRIWSPSMKAWSGSPSATLARVTSSRSGTIESPCTSHAHAKIVRKSVALYRALYSTTPPR
mmetsp:Transcript_4898/g.15934  ORF Transcript_4898/g.15934 Transcript_4898/m.15934 type:complete len:261 (+) Transcript_4898:172-954(+)